MFDEEMSREVLSSMGNPLEALSEYVDFEHFRPVLEATLFTCERKSNAGRPPFDCVLMFKVLFLQRYYGLGDKQAQYQMAGRISFCNFLGIRDVRDIPDGKTVWNYKERLTRGKIYDKLFDAFRSYLDGIGFRFNEDRIIDGSFVAAPCQRTPPDENKEIKEGRGPGCGKTSPTRNTTRITMPVGRKSAEENFTVTICTPRQTGSIR